MANTEATVEAIFRSLPARFRGLAEDEFRGVFHWVIEGADHPEWTVTIEGGRCHVALGLVGGADCVTSMTEDVFLGVETGARSPVSAYMKGRIRVSNVGKLRRYEQYFFKFHDAEPTVAELPGSSPSKGCLRIGT